MFTTTFKMKVIAKCEGQNESNASYFSIINYNYSYHEIYRYHRCILYKGEIIFPLSLCHYQHSFSTPAWVALCRSWKFFAKVLQGLPPLFFLPLLKQQTHGLTELTSMVWLANMRPSS